MLPGFYWRIMVRIVFSITLVRKTEWWVIKKGWEGIAITARSLLLV